MPVVTTDKLREQLRRREIAPVYVLYGAETHRRDAAARTIADFSFGEGDLRDFNLTEYSLNTEDNLQRAMAAADQLPMMSAKRVVRISDVRIGATAIRDTIKEEHEKILKGYLERPSPSTVLIFVADELNGNRKMTKLLKSHAAIVEFAPLDDNALIEWAANAFKKAGAVADGNAVRRLVGLVGNELRRLENEVDKLVTAALPDKSITVELIDDLVPDTREMTNFALTNSLNAGDRRKAIVSLRKVLDDGAEPLMLLGSISYNYRRLAMVKDMMARGIDRNEITRVLNLRYGDQETFLATARRAETAFITKSLKRIAETDIAIKTSMGGGGPIAARMQLEMLVAELALG